MCTRCEGEPYRGVRALFNGDLQAKMDYEDREDWVIVSDKVIVYLGESALANEDNILYRGCEMAVTGLNETERFAIDALSRQYARPATGGL